jgi:aspartyl aminopeptidase
MPKVLLPKPRAMSKVVQEAAKDFLAFVNRSPSPYHVVAETKRRLIEAGFSELNMRDSWNVQPSGKYFVINNFSAIIAFAVGGQYKQGNGFSIVGAHTDSPCFRVKPRSIRNHSGYVGVGVEPYGGGIWHTWFDRDLKLAGRVVLKDDDGLIHRLVHVDAPILRIPNICIHLARADVHNAFAPNKETHTVPVLATALQEKLESVSTEVTSGLPASKHQPLLLSLLSKKLDCDVNQIMDFELYLADTQPATIGGALDEFIFSPRIDNQLNCYAGLEGLLKGLDTLADDSNVRMLALFDNEEVGSESAQGANSCYLEFLLRRISAGGESSVAFEESMPKSFLISADQAHAIHPNYPYVELMWLPLM